MIKCVVPVSGGKDSQACLKLAAQVYEKAEIVGLFCDTQFEHPLTYEHIDRIESLYGIEIKRLCEGSVPSEVERTGIFPGMGGARHCTEELKIKPTKQFCVDLADEQGGFELWYGMRSGESGQRSKRYEGKVDDELYMPHEIMPSKYPKYIGEKGVRFRLPILSWSKEDVLDYLNGEENPLYSQGFDRVGCFPCLAAGDKWKEKAFRHDDFGQSQWERVKDLEQKTGYSVFTTDAWHRRNNPDQNELFDDPGCLVCSI